ncbi:MAG TPA: trypsin-like peptidase domain-containing protein [Thermoanaerobaculia bacterium]|nr:trypsin-like peptidase domain-containing protein [Thermoanaerobaculia bacterium]
MAALLLLPAPPPASLAANAQEPSARERSAADEPSSRELRRTPVVRVVERVSPAVVNISAEAMVRQPDPFFGGFFTRRRRAQSLGSGLIVAPDGVVVTNAHVIEGASRITVTTLDGRELEAEVLGSDRDADLAVLKVEAAGLPAVELGTSADLLIGETVVAIGNPFGLGHTVTAGTLSARGRALPPRAGDPEIRFTDFLQTDASINPGNSGGPLVNLAGEVIGINTAIIQGANGIGFAIPADRARRMVSDLVRFGELQPLWTGLRLVTLDPMLARERDLPVDRGALVYRVYLGSPGERAGFEDGDVIVSVAGQPVTAREDVTTAFYTAPEGSPVTLTVARGDRRVPLRLVPGPPPEGLGLEFLEQAVGLRVSAADAALVIRTVLPDSPAAAKGLRPGDRILAANGQRITDLDHLARELLRALDRGGLLLVVQRGRYAYNLNFPL